MPSPYDDIPEFATRHAPASLMRLPPGDDIPLTPRVRRVIDTPAFRRLMGVSQLGLVRLVYPGAGHTRFEHSLGAYRVALDFLERLSTNDRFVASVTVEEAERFLLAALLHDVGHWPYCHPLEDIELAGTRHHESLARQAITTGELADVVAGEWSIDPAKVADLIEGNVATPGERIAGSMLSGPIDVDKIDYLARDSRHCGVPYGQNFDQRRLVASLTLNAAGDRIAVTDKGKTAAELMVFARYVMFSEVYWHHAVRAATAMLQRAMHELELDCEPLFSASDEQFARHMLAATDGSPAGQLLAGVFGSERRLYKRVAQYSLLETPDLYEQLARRPYAWLVTLSGQVAARLSQHLGERVAPHEVLLDTPPAKLEVQFDVDVFSPKEGAYHPLGDVSPVVRTLAREQFDDYVKRVRVYVSPRLAPGIAAVDVDAMVFESIK